MSAVEHERLWRGTLGDRGEDDPYRAPRQKLRQAYMDFRGRAALLAAEIARDLPDFTIHDETHSDALWELANLIVGPDIGLTPAEAFVLGGAFLIHDLGMAVAAYPDGVDALRASPYWKDTLVAVLRDRLGRMPSAAEVDSATHEDMRAATAATLRHLHAQCAERLALIQWTSGAGGEVLRLIEDSDLRSAYGRIIGAIAHSHAWPVGSLQERFARQLGAPALLPQTWTVDPLRIACLFRGADAAHLDARRAPAFLSAVRPPSPGSEAYWVFQRHLHRPTIQGDRLVFTSGHAFSIAEADAWWQCYDALRIVDAELAQVDALLVDTGRPRFDAHRVAYVEEPARLSVVVPTDGWSPVDTRVRVSDVAGLVRRLGGAQLYGDDATVPLRELIQNAADAIRARRLLEDRPSNWGQITVRLGRSGDTDWIEVEDNGIGMPSDVLTGPFLDFGVSYWDSRRAQEQLPGLLAKGFRPTGRYGIGFFSVFMWGGRARVTSRPYAGGHDATSVLQFEYGPADRLLLRKATPGEYLREGGTVVRVALDKKPDRRGGLLYVEQEDRPWTLQELIAWVAPALDVDVYCQTYGASPTLAVGADDWETISGSDLLRRLAFPRGRRGSHATAADSDRAAAPTQNRDYWHSLDALGTIVRPLKDAAGDVVGRLCMLRAPDPHLVIRGHRANAGVVVDGGLRVCDLQWLGGVLHGTTMGVARNLGVPKVETVELAQWASGQADLLQRLVTDHEAQAEHAEVVHACGGVTGDLPIALSAEGWLTAAELIAWAAECPEVVVVQDAAVHNDRRHRRALLMMPGVLACAVGQVTFLRGRGLPYSWSWEMMWPQRPSSESLNRHWQFHRYTLEGLVIRQLSQAWQVPVAEIVDASKFSDDDRKFVRQYATADGVSIEDDNVDIIVNPRAQSGDQPR